jgi:hypothetical protein
MYKNNLAHKHRVTIFSLMNPRLNDRKKNLKKGMYIYDALTSNNSRLELYRPGKKCTAFSTSLLS